MPILSFKTLLNSVFPEYLLPMIEYIVGYKLCFTKVLISPIFLLFISISRIIEYQKTRIDPKFDEAKKSYFQKLF